jgi:hypothetical protein
MRARLDAGLTDEERAEIVRLLVGVVLPSRADRAVLLERAVAGLPRVGPLDLDLVVERTGGWTGTEIVVTVEEAISRSLLDHTDALTC